MRREFTKATGIFALALAFGLFFTGCDQTAEIFVTNRSNVIETDGTVRIQIWGGGAAVSPLREETVPLGYTASFSMNVGDYRVRVVPIRPDGTNASDGSWFPQDGRVYNMRGSFRLLFDGHELRRTN